MQVNMHLVERVEVIDFPNSEGRPFTILRLTDGKSSTVDVFLREVGEVEKLAVGVLDVLAKMRTRQWETVS